MSKYFLLHPPGPSRDGTISEDTIRASLISAVSDKLRWRMKEEMDRAQAELNALKRTEEDLKKGHQKLEEMVTRLDQEVVSNSSKTYTFWIVAMTNHSGCILDVCIVNVHKIIGVFRHLNIAS
jgi:succinate dehydrogenase/fumarate reductase flavoprotein subunit